MWYYIIPIDIIGIGITLEIRWNQSLLRTLKWFRARARVHQSTSWFISLVAPNEWLLCTWLFFGFWSHIHRFPFHCFFGSSTFLRVEIDIVSRCPIHQPGLKLFAIPHPSTQTIAVLIGSSTWWKNSSALQLVNTNHPTPSSQKIKLGFYF